MAGTGRITSPLRWAAGAAAAALLAAGTARAADAPGCALAADEVFAAAAPGVVQVVSLGIDPFRVAGRVRAAQGSGFVFGEDLVATNFHVVVDSAQAAVNVDGQFLQAQVIGIDPLLDIAVLRVPFLRNWAEALELAPDGDVRVGAPAYVIGYPLGLGKSLSAGVVSGLQRKVPLNTSSWLAPMIQTDAAISAGNSGGPLLDACGRVIGLATLHLKAPEAENVGLAIPASVLRPLLPELAETGKVARPWHGIYGQMVTPQILFILHAPIQMWTDGFLVETVEAGSAADKAGLRGGSLPVMWGASEVLLGGDIITEVDGRRVSTLRDAIDIVQSLEIGQTVEVKILREGEEMTLTATMEERPLLERDMERYREQ